MFALFIFLLILWPIAELIAIVWVAGMIGIPWTILLLFAPCIAGAFVLRYQGRSAWRRFNEALRAGKTPTREVVDGVLVVTGGLLLLIPGFITDIFGLILILPPTRAPVRGLVTAYAQSNLVVKVGTTAYGGASSVWQRRAGRGRRDAPPEAEPAIRGYDVEGTAVEVDQRQIGK